MAMASGYRWSSSLLVLVLLHAGCDGSRVTEPSKSTATPESVARPGDGAEAQALPQAVFQTKPTEANGRIGGASPLEVQFNLCRSRPSDAGDELKYTYDFDADGKVDEFGNCRARHTFVAPARARVCVSNRRPDGSVCRVYQVDATGEPTPPVPEHVLRLALNDCGQVGSRYQYLRGVITPPVPVGQPYAISLNVDGEMGTAQFRQTVAFVDEADACGGFSGYRVDSSPLPNDYVVDVADPPCPHERIFVWTAIETTTPALADRLTTTVTGFQVPGRRARIEGEVKFTCP
jgi:hypothetical protein